MRAGEGYVLPSHGRGQSPDVACAARSLGVSTGPTRGADRRHRTAGLVLDVGNPDHERCAELLHLAVDVLDHREMERVQVLLGQHVPRVLELLVELAGKRRRHDAGQ